MTKFLKIALVIAILLIVGLSLKLMNTKPAEQKQNEKPVVVVPKEEEPKINPTYKNASADLIQVELPYPGAVTGKEFSVKGKARGFYFFEASFPVELQTPAGDVLYTGIATAEGDWMTEDFVKFTAPMKAPSTFMGPAVLVLKNDNPSGMPEKDSSVSFPITVEY